MKVFLTGASGLVGTHLVHQLVSKGFDIKALKRQDSVVTQFEGANIEWVEGDLFNIHLLIESMLDCDFVLHSAALVSFNPREKDLMLKTNIEGTKNIVDAALEANIKRLVYVSSVAALGKTDNGDAIDEDTKWTSNDERANYDISKFNAELEVWRGAEEGLEVNVVNPSVILGDGDWDRSSSKLFKFIYNNSKLYTEGLLNFVDVRDVAEQCVFLLDATVCNERFLLCADHIGFKEFYSKVALAFGKPSPTILSVWQKIESLRASIFKVSPLITKETIRSLKRPSKYNNIKSVNLLDVRYRSVDDTIAWITQSYFKKYELV